MQRDIKEIADLAIKYTSQDLGKMVQQGLLDPTKAMMAGMMRKRIAADEMKPPETTVMDDVLGQPEQPQQQMGQQPEMQPENPQEMAETGGIASLDAGDTGNYAGGGMVAFDEGGYVPGYAGNERSDVKEDSSSRAGRALNTVGEYLSAPDIEAEAQHNMGQRRRAILDRAAEIDPGIFGQETASQMAAREAEEDALRKQLVNLKPQPIGMADVKKGRAASAGLDKLLAAMPVSPEAAAEQSNVAAAPADKKQAEKGKAIVGGTKLKLPTDQQQQITVPKLDQNNYLGLPAIDPNLGKVPFQKVQAPTAVSVEDAFEEEKKANKLAGFDENIFNDMKRVVSDKKDKLSQRKDEAAGFALMAASLGLMGARQGQVFQTLSAEAKSALSGYVGAIKDIRENESKLEDKIMDLNVAENQYKATKSQSALARVRSIKDKIDAVQAKNVEIENKAKSDEATLASHIFAYTTQATTSRYVADQNFRGHQVSAASVGRPGETERITAEYTRILNEQGPAAAAEYERRIAIARGAGKPEGILSDAEIMKIVVPTLLPGKNSPAEIAKAVKEYKEAAGLISGAATKPAGVVDQNAVKGLLGK